MNKDFLKKLSIKYNIDPKTLELYLPYSYKYNIHIYDVKSLFDKYKNKKYVEEHIGEKKFINKVDRWLKGNYKQYNTERFRPAGSYFQEHDIYTNVSKNSHPYSSYMKFWFEEARRSLYGYYIDGEWITGYHYFYLNYSPIELVQALDENQKGKSIQGERIVKLPFFWDSDFFYFHYLEEAERNGLSASVLKTRGRGYEQPISEPVLTPNGFKAIGDIKIGDEVIGSEGKPIKVKDIISQGNKDIYNIELQDGRHVRCGLNHLWGVYNTKRKYMVVDTKYLTEHNLKQHPNTNKSSYSYRLPSVKPIEFKKQDLELDPYVLGIMIGDGGLTSSPMKLSSNDKFIVNKVDKLLPDNNVNKLKYDKYGYSITSKHKDVNYFTRIIKKLKLNVKSYYKFIPEQYKYTSIDDRLELVRGLMDSDGTVSFNGNSRFVNTSEKLIDDLAWVLRSLGIRCNKSKTNHGGKIRKFPNGYKSLQHNLWILSITSINTQIFKLPRKADILQNSINKRVFKNQDRVGIKSITKLNYKEESVCLYVDSSDHLYTTKDFVLTHNSWKAATMPNRNFFLIPRSRSVIYASSNEYLLGQDGVLTKAWSQMAFINKNTAWSKRRQKKDTETYKRASLVKRINGVDEEYGFLSEIAGVTLKADPDKARGKRAKLILYEEAGSFNDLIHSWIIAEPSVKQGKISFGLRIAFGTGGEQGPGFEGLRKFFYRPDGFKIYSLPNIWSPGNMNNEVSWFQPEYMNREGFYDKDGNSDVDSAIRDIEEERAIAINAGADSETILRSKAEAPIVPEDAMLRTSASPFPRALIKEQQIRLEDSLLKGSTSRGKLIINSDNKVLWNENLEATVIEEHIPRPDNRKGAIEIFESPIEAVKDSNYGYIIGVDPIDFDYTEIGDRYSLGSCFVMNTFSGNIVAEFTGRPDLAVEFYEIVRRLSIYYNAQVMFENNIKGLHVYFVNQMNEYRLARKPRILDDGDVLIKTGSKKYGFLANERVNKLGLELIKKWLLEPLVDHEGMVRVHSIKSKGLLNELLDWNPDGNFDRVSAMAAVLIFYQDISRLLDDAINDTDKIDMASFWRKAFVK